MTHPRIHLLAWLDLVWLSTSTQRCRFTSPYNRATRLKVSYTDDTLVLVNQQNVFLSATLVFLCSTTFLYCCQSFWIFPLHCMNVRWMPIFCLLKSWQNRSVITATSFKVVRRALAQQDGPSCTSLATNKHVLTGNENTNQRSLIWLGMSKSADRKALLFCTSVARYQTELWAC